MLCMRPFFQLMSAILVRIFLTSQKHVIDLVLILFDKLDRQTFCCTKVDVSHNHSLYITITCLSEQYAVSIR